MTDSNYTHLMCVVDRSGSMSWNRTDVDMTNALNKFFEEQANVAGKCLVDYVQFDTEHETVYEDRPVSEAKAVIQPRGGTALLDAIGFATVNLGNKLKSLSEDNRPGKVLVVIVTDGHENSSIEYKQAVIKKMITEQQDNWNWEYVFLGANIDAVAVGDSYGIGTGNSLTFDTRNTRDTISSLNAYTTSYRSGSVAAFTDEDRKNAIK